MNPTEPAAGADMGAARAPDPRLAAMAAAIDQDLAEPGAGGQELKPEPAVPLEREIAGMFAMVGTGLGQFFPSVKIVLDDPACKNLGDSLAPVARKYGIDRHLAGLAWRTELQALFVTVPIAFALKAAISHDLAQYRAAQASAGPGGRADAPAPAGPGAPAGADAPAPVQKLEPVTP